MVILLGTMGTHSHESKATPPKRERRDVSRWSVNEKQWVLTVAKPRDHRQAVDDRPQMKGTAKVLVNADPKEEESTHRRPATSANERDRTCERVSSVWERGVHQPTRPPCPVRVCQIGTWKGNTELTKEAKPPTTAPLLVMSPRLMQRERRILTKRSAPMSMHRAPGAERGEDLCRIS